MGLGVHGWDHGFGDSNEDFFIDRFEIQKRNILKTKKLLEELINTDVILNRNPNLWVNDQLPYVLEQVGMKIDSRTQLCGLLVKLGSLSIHLGLGAQNF